MPRNNRPRRGNEHVPLNFERINSGSRRTESRAGREWTVQTITESNAQKDYVCPGCSGTITPGVAHLVAWRNDGIMGDQADLADRRHWHNACWKVS